jgi:hypothetical protein
MSADNNNSFNELIFKVEYKPSDIVAQSNIATYNRPHGITVAGTTAFRNTITAALWNLMKRSQYARELIIKVLELNKVDANGGTLIIEYQENIVDLGGSGFHDYIGINISPTQYDHLNGRTDGLIIGPTIETALIHELDHVKRRREPVKNQTYYCTDESNRMISFSEVLAVKSENITRVQLGLSIRTLYNGVNVFRKMFRAEPARSSDLSNENSITVYKIVIDPNEPKSEVAFEEYHTATTRNKKWTESDLDQWKKDYTINNTKLIALNKSETSSFAKTNQIKQRPVRGDSEFYIEKK